MYFLPRRAGNYKPAPGAMVNWNDPLTQGLVGAWLFNEGSGNSVRDHVDQGASIIDYRGLTTQPTWAAGDTGPQLVNPNSGTQFGTIAYNSRYNCAKYGLSIVCRLRLLNVALSQFLVCKPNDTTTNGDVDWGLQLFTNTFRMFVSNTVAVSGVVTQSANTTVSVAATIDTTGTARIYVNGALDTASASGNALPTNGALPMRVGSSNSSIQPYNGRYDHIYLYERALTLQEIEQTYRRPYQIFQNADWAAIRPLKSNIIRVNVTGQTSNKVAGVNADTVKALQVGQTTNRVVGVNADTIKTGIVGQHSTAQAGVNQLSFGPQPPPVLLPMIAKFGI